MPEELENKITQQMSDGYEMQEQGENRLACDHWLMAWKNLKTSFAPWSISSLEGLESSLKGPQFLFNWIQDLEMILVQLSEEDLGYAEKGIQFFQEFLILFPKEDKFISMQFYISLAELFFKTDDAIKGESLFMKIIEENPNTVGGAVSLAEAWAQSGNSYGENEIYLDRALALLKKTEALDIEDAKDWDLDRRIENLLITRSNTE